MNTLLKNIVASIILALSLGAISTSVAAGHDGNQQQNIAKLQAKQKAQAEAPVVEAKKLEDCNKQGGQTQPKS